MSNSSNTLSPTSRALLIGAMAGGGASIAKNWKNHQQGQLSTNELVSKATSSALKTGALSGASTYVAGQMAGRPALSLMTIISAGVAGVYLMDQFSEKKNEQ
ncbi:magnetosome protein MamC [Veronia pacifica]|uniref:Uncharacterized protein n=1 Tax=Veronia pacifica TaxID=1080227 RepID=A0A1C3ES92_9GAMM|nr:magnetosome protein MamC [Veronia pacifica]ODA36068.1 hypothetical protein A8L45_00225 [Veronia pacifica]